MGAKGGINPIERKFNAAISERIEELLSMHKVLRGDLAKVAGVTPQMLYAYTVGVTRWPVFRLCLIARFFDVDVEELTPDFKQNVVSLPLQRKLP